MADIKVEGTIIIDDVEVDFDIVRTAATGRALLPHIQGDNPDFFEYAWIILRAMGHVDDDTTMVDAFERIDAELAQLRASPDVTSNKGRRISDRMRLTLNALDEYEGCIDAGATMGEVEASGGSRGVLYSAVDKGWVDYYPPTKHASVEDRGRRYYRTAKGSKVLETGRV